MYDTRNFNYCKQRMDAEKSSYTLTKIGDNMKFTYSIRMEQKANFVYNKLGETAIYKYEG